MEEAHDVDVDPNTEPELVAPYDWPEEGICIPLKLDPDSDWRISLLFRERPRAGMSRWASSAPGSAPTRLPFRRDFSIASGRSRKRIASATKIMLAAKAKIVFGNVATVPL